MSTGFGFTLVGEDTNTRGRAGVIQTTRGPIETPVFMPVGTLGTVKGLTPAHLEELGASIILGNAYHLYLRPGLEVIEALGGLHRMAGWSRAILTDSGGFQVYSLRNSSKVTEEGVTFRSHVDGSSHLLTPERSIAIQETLGSDIMMVFDQCPPSTASRREVAAAAERTHRWAHRCLDARTREESALFAIVQGGVDPELRRQSWETLSSEAFEGFAIGGLSVGEDPAKMAETVAYTAPALPSNKPRYLMGVGTPEDLLACVSSGVDMFDCVIPSRHARNGRLVTARGDINIRNATHRLSDQPICDRCDCYTCRNFSRAYLRHLNRSKEILFSTLGTIHNLRFYVRLMQRAREEILRGEYESWRDEILAERGVSVEA